MSKKKTYQVCFYYGNDLRCFSNVIASNELTALAKALDKQFSGDNWVEERNSRVTIELK